MFSVKYTVNDSFKPISIPEFIIQFNKHHHPVHTNMTKQKQPTRSVPFRSEIRASGAGETWSHTDDGNAKFQQFGWRCTNDENAYKEDVLIGNWNEKQFDVARLKSNVKMSSPYGHRYSAFKKIGPASKFGHFEVFGVKFSAKKSIFQNCLSGSPYGLV